jgi:hypothetical protein
MTDPSRSSLIRIPPCQPHEIALLVLCRSPGRLRAVVVPWSGITGGELKILTKAGTVDYRITHRLDAEQWPGRRVQ